MAGRKESSLYTSKADLIQWAGDLLHLRLSRLEQFASGAVYCQLLDAHFENVINLQRVNFHAREEYEFLPNYKQLQAALARLRVQRTIDVSKLSRAAPVDNLELLQWTFKYLKGRNVLPDYDPAERRMHSVKGGTDVVPLPIWLGTSFDVYGRGGAGGGASPAEGGQANPSRSRQVSRTPSARTSATSVASMGSASQKARPARSSVRTMPLTPTAEDRAMPQVPPPSGPAVSARSARRSSTPSRTPSNRRATASTISATTQQTPTPPIRANSFTRIHQQNGITPRGTPTPPAASTTSATSATSANRERSASKSVASATPARKDPPAISRSHRTATPPAPAPATSTSASASAEPAATPDETPEPSTPRAISPTPDGPGLPVSSAGEASENGVNGHGDSPPVAGPLAPTPAPISTPIQVPRIPAADTRHDPGSPNSDSAALSPSSKDGISDAVDVLGQAVSLLQRTAPNLGRLAPALGTANDSYAFRGKMRSLQDATSTLAQHCWRLLRDLQELSGRRGTATHPRLAAAGLAPLVQELQACDSMLAGVRSTVAAAEAEVGPPQPNPPRLADQHRELSSTKHLDAMLRTLGSAHAAMLQRCHREAATVTARFLDMAQPSSPTSSQASGPVQAAENGERTFTTTKVLKLGEYQMKRLKNGDIYKGRYVSNRKNGEGVYSFINADVYEGQFKDDRMEGHGVYTFSHEGRYEGQWSHAVYEGSGAETFAKGSTYQGQYTLGLRHGWGACRFYSGDYYEGHWFRGLRDGRGMQQCTDDSNYVGDYHKGKRHGFGVYSFPNGDRYVGEYQEDIPHGHGVYLFATGQSYEGQWVSGRKHGWSIYTVETGERWAGQWKEGKPLWVQPLPPADAPPGSDTADTGRKEDADGGVQSNLDLSWAACRAAQQAALQAAKRADDHWRCDGEIQRGIGASLGLAGAAAEEAQRMRASARELAARLDSAAALVEDRKLQAPAS